MNNIFSIIGNNFFERQNMIEKIKSKISKTVLDTFIFYSKELDIYKLKEEFFTSSFDRSKLLIFKDTFYLPNEIKNFFIKNFKEIPSGNYIIFEIEDYNLKDAFLDFILKNTTILRVNRYTQNDYMEIFRRSIRKRDIILALFSLNNLFNSNTNRNLATQLLGILVNEFSYINDDFRKQKIFDHLFNLDREIKENLIEGKTAIEFAVIKMLKA